ncbi:hypothetical protein T08_10194, partial [Trichinella sp. T8]
LTYFKMSHGTPLEKKKLMAKSIAKIYTLLCNRFGNAEEAIKNFDALQKKEEQLTEQIAFVTAQNENFLRKEEACNSFKQNIAEMAKKYDIIVGYESNSLSFDEIEMLFQSSINQRMELLNEMEAFKLSNKNLENSVERKNQELEDAKMAFIKEKSEIYENMNTDFAAQTAAFSKEKDELLDRINSVTEESELLRKMLAQETEKSNAIKEHYENENNNLKCENEKIRQENLQLKESTEKILQQLQSETEMKSKEIERYECFLEYLWKKIDHGDKEFETLREKNRSIMKKNENLYNHVIQIVKKKTMLAMLNLMIKTFLMAGYYAQFLKILNKLSCHSSLTLKKQEIRAKTRFQTEMLIFDINSSFIA